MFSSTKVTHTDGMQEENKYAGMSDEERMRCAFAFTHSHCAELNAALYCRQERIDSKQEKKRQHEQARLEMMKAQLKAVRVLSIAAAVRADSLRAA